MTSFPYRLLVADDESSMRDLLQMSLSKEGYEVRVAKDGFDALAQMRGALPDLILTDLKMPNMSGFEFLSVVRRRFPQIPTIAISGEYESPVQELGVLADAFLAKPHMPKELFAKIAELLDVAPLRPALPKERAPVWVPRNGKYYVITCTDCLRSFSIPTKENDRVVRDLRTLNCIFCNALVEFIVEEKFRVIPGRTGTPAP
jgi:CheY-like chemotaxis protein